MDVNAGRAAPMRENSESKLILVGLEPGLAQVQARVDCRAEVAAPVAARVLEHIAEDESSVEGAGEEVSDGGKGIEPPCVTEKVVVSESSFDLEEVDRAESRADPGLPLRSLLHADDEHLRRVFLTRYLDRSPPEQIRFVERALAVQKLRPLEQIARPHRERVQDHPRLDVLVSFHDDIRDCRLPSRIELD